MNKLLIANRGEIAIRIARAAADLGIVTLAIYPKDDIQSLHTRVADESVQLEGTGNAAYLDSAQIIEIAKRHSCDAIHPGYGFLSEQAEFTKLCTAAGLVFVGPHAEILQRLGNKASARLLAKQCGVPVIPGLDASTNLQQAREFLSNLPPSTPALLKAIAGGGGRGMRIIHRIEDLEDAFQQCSAEALSAFGNGDLYIEKMIPHARHIEIQILGDGSEVAHLWERECSLQRKHQKVLEIAPSPTLSTALRNAMIQAALEMARTVRLNNLSTFEFLLDSRTNRFFFIEANPRLQVEHTITEAVTDIDLVQAQLCLANGETLHSLALQQSDIPQPRGHAMQLRINMETLREDGSVQPEGGTLDIFEPPGGPGIRIDSFGYAGYTINPRYDSLLMKLVLHTPTAPFDLLVKRAYRALCQTRIRGVQTNIEFLKNLLCHPEVVSNRAYTRFIDEHLPQLLAPLAHSHPVQCADTAVTVTDESIYEHPEGLLSVVAPMSGLLMELYATKDQPVHKGQAIALIESMKMQHTIKAPEAGFIRRIPAIEGASLREHQALVFMERADIDDIDHFEVVLHSDTPDIEAIRPDLAEALAANARVQDDSRPQAVQRRHAMQKRTARENINDLCDSDSFMEYGALTFAARRGRYSVEELSLTTPADGLVAGIGQINGDQFDTQQARALILAYDYTVLAGTQGLMSHKKLSRMLAIAADLEIPIVLYAEGGGGRPGDDDDATRATGLNMPSFWQFAKLSGLVPRISIVSGRCFAGNAVLAGCSDILIATRDANIGMAGPAMVEGAGLGTFAAEDIGPVDLQTRNGVVDFLAEDEAHATLIAKQIIGYFQGTLPHWECKDQRLLRNSVPENRMRSYEMWSVIETLADLGTAIQLRQHFASNMITALVRIEGQPLAILANNPLILGGAIDSDAADKAARFLQSCDAFDIPVLSICDTPGFMVGPDTEKSAPVRHASRMFAVAANLDVPLFSLITRKAYGLGAMAMTGGSFHAPSSTMAWPTGEFGGMGFEGAVRLAYRAELDAITDQQEKAALFERLVDEFYQRGKATNVAASLEFDTVIDPADSRTWLVQCLQAAKKPHMIQGKKRPFIDTW
ncbi:carboxyl transferase domain-containing protein [Pseudomonas sp. FME51]|uniref:carboxyl transferase domain-containing protein n=1 Tax=Pseudomonas sp. FME51 TaxID=2742609 RepID=UPI001D007C1B|nr:carboxyl transferase domain-containing protein [Pseudomonas sp. FME51]